MHPKFGGNFETRSFESFINAKLQLQFFAQNLLEQVGWSFLQI